MKKNCCNKFAMLHRNFKSTTVALALVAICLFGVTELSAQRFDRSNFSPDREAIRGSREQSHRAGGKIRELIRERLKKMREQRSDNTTPSAPVVIQDIAYAQHHQRNLLDLYAPENASDLPVLIYIHGGAWRNGDKSGVGGKPAFFTSNGWIFISINYRLLPDGQHPNNVEDVAAALAWVYDNVGAYGGSRGKIYLTGFSAGAHLAALVAIAPEFLREYDKDLSIIKGVILLDIPVSDVVDEAQGDSAQRLIDSFGTDPEAQKNGSPAHQVAPGNGIPPFLMFYSSGIPFGSYASKDFEKQASILCEALKRVDVLCSAIDVTELNHGNLNNLFGSPGENLVTIQSMEFLESLLK